MILWSGYVRPARVPGRVVGVARFDSIHRLGLHPAFTLRKRVNAVEVVGEAITAVAEGRYSGLAVSRQTAYGRAHRRARPRSRGPPGNAA